MNLDNALGRVRVVLSRTSHPGNIGAAARAMKTMGLTQLVLVSPLSFPDPVATARAAGADDILAGARVVDTLAEALEGTVFAAAMTARRREMAVPMKWAREAAGELVSLTGHGDVALVFGNETKGLSNDDVALCHMPVKVPVSETYSSLNLGAAVQVLCYELRMAALDPGLAPSIEFEPATHEQIEGFYAHLDRAITASGFFNPENSKRLWPRLRRLFGRIRLERDEINILRGMLNAFEKK
ncbi:RNA methyltransferase [Zoogloea sp.]|jgi:tRNA/rRNA methyltransferase|uniref:RNA methyltransferase n=1 Tax=Zoogloea sp. TaxID=49181 RepID=UPI001B61D186|nr:RNA methyltransferase [Zoogloea sp.]MBK6652946.1 RNA methyltransferase [Zoogloea sp.]MBK7847874.1 RNA methyltransferase [Zoogloea sp.]MBP7444498.1 RNA methyltransferase [Zoogloea sp.]HOY00442.1 RNA methyltransferase [Zoogloea sp.]HPI58659.1 RNA methyltransferase [Zoogloea sp.]